MKTLIFNTFYYPNQVGGAEKSVQLLAEGLVKEGVKVSLVTTSNKDYIDDINGVKVHYVKTNNLYWAYNSKEEKKFKKPIWHLIDSYNPFNKKIANILDKEKPDIFHTNNLAGFSVSVWKLAKDKNIKIVHTLRDYYLLCPKSTMFNEKKLTNCEKQCFSCKIYSFPKKIMSNYVDGVVGVSNFILNKHLSFGYFKNAKLKTYIYNPVKVSPKLINKKNFNKKVRVGLVGLISKSKGTEFIIDKLLKMKIKDIKIHIFGKSKTLEYEKYLKNKYKNYDIIFHGFQKPEFIYSNIDILVISSLWHEPFPRTLIESLSYGIPVLATNRGGTKEMIIEAKNGYVFDPDKEADFEEKVKKVLEMYRKGKLGLDIVRFKQDQIVKEYINAYKKLL